MEQKQSVREILFQPDEIKKLAGRNVSGDSAETIAFLSFESRFAKSGGLAAVINQIMPYTKEVFDVRNVILISPFYPNISDKSKLTYTGISIEVPFGNVTVPVNIYEYIYNYRKPSCGYIRELYLEADGFFTSENKLNDPYIYSINDPEENSELLRKNSLFYSAAVPHVLSGLGLNENIILHMQDWETILAGLTVKIALLNEKLKSCRTVFTMHNPYDSGWIPLKSLEMIFNDSIIKRLVKLPDDDLTALKLGMPFIDSVITTVSKNFAKELKKDKIFTSFFIPHLVDIIEKKNITGINNGAFMGISTDYIPFMEKYPKEPERVTSAMIDEIKKIKTEKRSKMLEVLDNYDPVERFGKLRWNRESVTNLPADIPVLMMSGRLDPNQKGYDVLLKALSKFREDEIKAVLSPMPVRYTDLDYFYQVACKETPGNITVFPIRMEKGYMELMQGCTFGLMPSVYEPFGAAIEYMVSGAPVIARKTGGLVDQVINGKNGILFREPARNYNLEHIQRYSEAANNIPDRENNEWFLDMADSLARALRKSVKLFAEDSDRYYEMIIRGLYRSGKFEWSDNLKQYQKIYL